MVNITIDNQKISVPSGTTIMEAAAKLGTPIPKLCYLKDINEIAACRVCVVEIEGKDRLVTSCNNVVTEGIHQQPKSTHCKKTDCTAYPFPA